jgi:hypothetical protein
MSCSYANFAQASLAIISALDQTGGGFRDGNYGLYAQISFIALSTICFDESIVEYTGDV